MAVNESRSLTRDLREGLTDGTVKKWNPDRGGNPNDNESAMIVDGVLQEQYGAYYSSSATADAANRMHTLKG